MARGLRRDDSPLTGSDHWDSDLAILRGLYQSLHIYRVLLYESLLYMRSSAPDVSILDAIQGYSIYP